MLSLKHILVALLLVAGGIGMQAQNNNLWDTYVIPRVGVGVSKITAMGGKATVSPNFGGGVRVFVGNKSAFDVNLQLAWQGSNSVNHTYASSESETGIKSGTYDYTFSLLNVDYLYRHYITDRINLFTGLRLTRVLSSHVKGEGIRKNLRSDDDVHSGDFAIPLGISYDYGSWTADLSYDFSLRHIASSRRAKNIMGSARLQDIQLTVGYRIRMY